MISRPAGLLGGGHTRIGQPAIGNARDTPLLTGSDEALKDVAFWDEDRRKNATRKISWAQRATQVPLGRTPEHELLTEGRPTRVVGGKTTEVTPPLKVLTSDRKYHVCKFQTAVPLGGSPEAGLWRNKEEPPKRSTSGVGQKRDALGNLVFDLSTVDDSSTSQGTRSWEGRREGQAASYCLLTVVGDNAYLVPVDQWYVFNPMLKNRGKSAEEAETANEQYRSRVLTTAKRLIGPSAEEDERDSPPVSPVVVRRKKGDERIDVDDEVGDEEKLTFDDDSDAAVSVGSVDRLFAAQEEVGAINLEEDGEDGEARAAFLKSKRERQFTDDGNVVQRLLRGVPAEGEDGDASSSDGEPLTGSQSPAQPVSPLAPSLLGGSLSSSAPESPLSGPTPAAKRSRRKDPTANTAPSGTPAPAAAPAPAAPGLHAQIVEFFQQNGNRKTPVKQLMKHLMKVDPKFQAVKANKDQRDACFKRLVANTNKIIAEFGAKEHVDGEIHVWLR